MKKLSLKQRYDAVFLVISYLIVVTLAILCTPQEITDTMRSVDVTLLILLTALIGKDLLGRPVKLRLLSSAAVKPVYATSGSACMDVYAAEGVIVEPGDTVAIGTGLAMEVPEGYKVSVLPRSGLALKGIEVIEGTIDSDYRGEIKVIMANRSTSAFTVKPGTRIAQIELVPVYPMHFNVVEELGDTRRGTGGFGSTGI